MQRLEEKTYADHTDAMERGVHYQNYRPLAEAGWPTKLWGSKWANSVVLRWPDDSEASDVQLDTCDHTSREYSASVHVLTDNNVREETRVG